MSWLAFRIDCRVFQVKRLGAGPPTLRLGEVPPCLSAYTKYRQSTHTDQYCLQLHA
mgnify:CR=1 FL=1|jgi:hypothetical protein